MPSQRENIEFLQAQLKRKESHLEIVEKQARELREERERLIAIITELQKIDEEGA